jgi:hypothetical protein
MSQFSCFFGNPTNKTVTGTAYTWGLLIANHLDQWEILSRSSHVQFITLFFFLEVHNCWTNEKYWAAAVTSNLLHSFFLEVHTCVAPFTSHGKLHKFGFQKTQFPEVNRHILTFSQWILLSGVTCYAPLEMLLVDKIVCIVKAPQLFLNKGRCKGPSKAGLSTYPNSRAGARAPFKAGLSTYHNSNKARWCGVLLIN